MTHSGMMNPKLISSDVVVLVFEFDDFCFLGRMMKLYMKHDRIAL
jgi:hypothetical protein